MHGWPVRELEAALAAWVPGVQVEVVPEIASTNSELMRRARAGSTAPVLLAAQHQSAGRGRLGRHWISRPGESLTFSLGLQMGLSDWSGLSLAAGVAIAESLHSRIQLKWPNDLWLDDRKLGGILIETAGSAQPTEAGGRYLVVGVGINILPRPEDGLSTPAAALAELLPGVDAGAALWRVAPALAAELAAFEAAGFEAARSRFEGRDALRGRAVSLSDGTAGTAQGVSAAGGLLVRTPGGLREITSSEVSVRPG